MSEKLERLDMEALVKLPAFLRFLSRLIQNAGIHAATTNGTDGRYLVSEGRRDLGLTTLRDAARGIAGVEDAQAAFTLLLIQVLREDAQASPQEAPRDRRTRYDDDEDADE